MLLKFFGVQANVHWHAMVLLEKIAVDQTAERRERAQDKPHPVEHLWFYVVHLALAHLCQNGLFHQEESVSIGQQQKK